ncbi:bis(5'-nucleosyl)-tetraphosphatase [asymmetrical] [Ischnura elegans]|uniref:bis(5'-nucleosyl)-tetraphosphatase [asymmetrical] n=1 Tax=Ischnura elegans TaxID=197161 RepID=UPI001ED8820B|nr:bis(5'-nucleosyl)-tetraphosphatase [asymmetrical] [Ischnura elegans]XP_046398253.1 bis(5'-nucleosyl)-tetraphosphatase [asymmetrical] [Ischnura elegans]XP_046398254.1 bis(5'-nucleosyl)-tetraphosphatase [asymmetrical] [Ischnura elegans]XP_046398255.1 bis(5'-nucleosyl)-tetraphosphatase [asymmetrical] [Ischnura elegans]XP_046398256.1 bis(5'-nucleosyl)-tetraphosphatase [asymmetrical] [Ischnura elegans]
MGLRAAGFVIYRVIRSRVEYLLLQTSYGIHHWTPPKGHVDPGESDLDTALRETEEESGLKKSDLKVLEGFQEILNYEVNGRPKTVTYWLAEIAHEGVEVKLSHEHQDYKWVPLDEACRLAGYSDMVDLLNKCENFILSSNKA